MKLDNRMVAMMEFMTEGGIGVDVGTDHGYLAVALVKSGKASAMIATDINEKPLQSAKRCVEAYGLENKIVTKLTDGLKDVDLENVTDILIAGMGGQLISEILSARHPLTQNLVLQPMTQADVLRRWLCEKGYLIKREKGAVVSGKAYSVINAAYDGQSRPCSPYFAMVGELPADENDPATAYLMTLRKRMQKKLTGLQRGGEDCGETQEVLAELEKALLPRPWRCSLPEGEAVYDNESNG